MFRIIARTAIIVAIGATAFACGTDQPPAQDAGLPGDTGAPADPTAIDTVQTGSAVTVPLTCDGLHDRILKAPATRRAFTDEFGGPDSVLTSVEPNRHVPGAVDSLFTVFYPGLVIDIRTPQGGRDMATQVRLEHSRYLAYPVVGPGATVERIEQILGEPTDRGADFITYDCGMGAEQPVTFRIRDGRITRIDIRYYVD